jgi:hypothetical protein
MKQTAVEWQHIELSKFLYGKSEFTDANDILIKAKEMEKEQIIAANIAGMEFIPVDPKRHQEDVEEYYNGTFNTNEG